MSSLFRQVLVCLNWAQFCLAPPPPPPPHQYHLPTLRSAVGYCGCRSPLCWEPRADKCSPFTTWSRPDYSHACFTHCQEFLPCLISAFHVHLVLSPLPPPPPPPPPFCFCFVQLLASANHFPRVGSRSQRGRPARRHRRVMPVPVLSAVES